MTIYNSDCRLSRYASLCAIRQIIPKGLINEEIAEVRNGTKVTDLAGVNRFVRVWSEA
jgi:hypothetical protein